MVRGNPVSLVCVADGTPHPAVSWLKEGLELDQEQDLSLLNLNTTLQLAQAQVNDTGRYTCVADNVAGQASRHFDLKVLGGFEDQIDQAINRSTSTGIKLQLI